MYNQETRDLNQIEVQVAQSTFITKVYAWMGLALGLTGVVAYLTMRSQVLTELIFGNIMVFYGLLGAELLLVIGLSWGINKISSTVARLGFLFYAALNGLTMSFIFMIYTSSSIASTFFICSATFGLMSAYGYYTKRDLTTLGNLAFMALIGLIIASVANMFFHNEILYWITTYAGVLIFVALTAYDTQKIKNMTFPDSEGNELAKKGAIMGALALYLDFVNLFLYLLRIFGKRK